ncbi:uncharacterized protein LOC142238885 [Haematobia irritans]|uniref:uncharacterized protein LOC142238885 n=1 Tax=Haematobia irritans TaxID=7368 RepID=UPI003F501605
MRQEDQNILFQGSQCISWNMSINIWNLLLARRRKLSMILNLGIRASLYGICNECIHQPRQNKDTTKFGILSTINAIRMWIQIYIHPKAIMYHHFQLWNLSNEILYHT